MFDDASAAARDMVAIADELWRARASARAIRSFASRTTLRSIGAAYAVQGLNVRRRAAAGGTRVGRKIGLTSAAVQRQFGVDEPDAGWLWADARHANGATVAIDALIAPRVEMEIALILAERIDAETLREGRLADAVDCAAPALEIVDSAIEDWTITLFDTVADNASGAGFVLGDARVPVTALSLPDVGTRMSCNGVEASSGIGSATMGGPIAALEWLARHAIATGDPLRAGEIVLTGALGPVVPARAGDRFAAELDGLGTVAIAFA